MPVLWVRNQRAKGLKWLAKGHGEKSMEKLELELKQDSQCLASCLIHLASPNERQQNKQSPTWLLIASRGSFSHKVSTKPSQNLQGFAMFSNTMHTAVNKLFYNPGPVFKVASISVVQNIHVQPQNYNQSLFDCSPCPRPAVVSPSS